MNVRDALQLASHVAVKTTALPILSHLRFAGGHISATDTIQQVEIPIDMPPELANEAFCIHGSRLVKLLKTLPAKADLQMSMKGKRFQVTAGDTEFELNTLPSGDFPAMEYRPDDATPHAFTVESKPLIDALRFVAPAMAVTDLRTFLIGVHIAVGPTYMKLTATDGGRLHHIKVELEEGPEVPVEGIIPAAGVDRIIEVAGRHTRVELALSPSRISITDRESLVMKLVDAKYPTFDRVIPRHTPVTGSVPREAFGEAAERVAQIFMQADRGGVQIEFSAQRIQLQAMNRDGERATTRLGWAQVASDLATVDMNMPWNQLADAMRAFSGETVFLHLPTGPGQSLYVTDDSDGTREAVIMPLRS